MITMRVILCKLRFMPGKDKKYLIDKIPKFFVLHIGEGVRGGGGGEITGI